MTRFPDEFEALLSAKGKRVLKGTHPACGSLASAPLFSSDELFDARKIAGLATLMGDSFQEILKRQVRALPSADAVKEGEPLPKVGRISTTNTASLDGALVNLIAEAIGLWKMVDSESCLQFCQRMAGQALEKPFTKQVLCLRPLDYSGPHADHYPDHPRARNGYVDLHFSFTTRGVKEQFIVYERDGHFAGMHSIAANGTLNMYRLPLWHYTTPMQAKSAEDRRWLVLASFLPSEAKESLT